MDDATATKLDLLLYMMSTGSMSLVLSFRHLKRIQSISINLCMKNLEVFSGSDSTFICAATSTIAPSITMKNCNKCLWQYHKTRRHKNRAKYNVSRLRKAKEHVLDLSEDAVPPVEYGKLVVQA